MSDLAEIFANIRVFLCMPLRLGSFRQLSMDVAAGKIRKFLPRVDKETYCANTVGNGLENMDTSILLWWRFVVVNNGG